MYPALHSDAVSGGAGRTDEFDFLRVPRASERCPPEAEFVSSNLAGSASFYHISKHLLSVRFVLATLRSVAEAPRKRSTACYGVEMRTDTARRYVTSGLRMNSFFLHRTTTYTTFLLTFERLGELERKCRTSRIAWAVR